MGPCSGMPNVNANLAGSLGKDGYLQRHFFSGSKESRLNKTKTKNKQKKEKAEKDEI